MEVSALIHGRYSCRHLWIVMMVAILMTLTARSAVNGQSDSCNINGSAVFSNLNLSAAIPFDTSSLRCTPVWNTYNFILRYAQNDTNVWSFLLSAPNMNSWVGVGLSKNGLMVGSSAIVGWIDQSGSGISKQYYLGGQSPSLVVTDQGNLDIVNNHTSILVQGSTIYLVFQLNFSTPLTSANILYAVGPQNSLPSNNVLPQHQDKVSTVLDFSTGMSSQSRFADKLRRNHGILNILGWGILLPVGVMIARYLRQWDPTWFYLHIFTQISGFILGVVGVAFGIVLYKKLNANVKVHRALGLLILSLGSFQVLATMLRPHKEAKTRKYWNWCHQWFGRILLVFVVVNIFYGIHLSNAKKIWNIGYGASIGFIFLIYLMIELIFMIKRFKNPTEEV